MVSSLQYEVKEKEREVQDRDGICDFLRAEIRNYDHRTKVQEEMLTKDAKCLLDQMTDKEAQMSEVREVLDTADMSFERIC